MTSVLGIFFLICLSGKGNRSGNKWDLTHLSSFSINASLNHGSRNSTELSVIIDMSISFVQYGTALDTYSHWALELWLLWWETEFLILSIANTFILKELHMPVSSTLHRKVPKGLFQMVCQVRLLGLTCIMKTTKYAIFF